jgi:hypothetical protein
MFRTSSRGARIVYLEVELLIRLVRFTEWRRETKEVQFNARRYFSGVSWSAPFGIRRDETRWRTPFEAYMSGWTRLAVDTIVFSGVTTISRFVPSMVVTT